MRYGWSSAGEVREQWVWLGHTGHNAARLHPSYRLIPHWCLQQDDLPIGAPPDFGPRRASGRGRPNRGNCGGRFPNMPYFV